MKVLNLPKWDEQFVVFLADTNGKPSVDNHSRSNTTWEKILTS